MTTTAWDPEETAARGAAMLDARWPGWRDQLDPDRLDMGSGLYAGRPDCKACVGAQLHHHRQVADLAVPATYARGEYAEFVDLLAPTPGYPWLWPASRRGLTQREWAAAHGFVTPDDLVAWPEEAARFDRLTDAWRAILGGGRP